MFVPRKTKGDLLPSKTDKRGPLYKHEDVADACMSEQETGTYMTRRAHTIQTDYDKAQEALDAGRKAYTHALDEFIDEEEKLADITKKAVSKIKNTTGKLGQSLLRLQNQADFIQLEKYVTILERADVALHSLAELEKAGTLKKISEALK